MAAREPGRVRYEVSVVDSGGGAVLGLEASVCRDAGCEPELRRCAGAMDDGCYGLAVGAEPSELVFDLPFGLDATIRFAAPGYVSLDYVLGGPMVGMPDGSSTVVGRPIEIVSFAAATENGAVDPTKGMLTLRTLDCSGAPASDIELLPIAGNFDGWVAVDDGFSNLQADRLTVGAYAADGTEYVRANVVVRPGVMSLAELRPGLGLWGQ